MSKKTHTNPPSRREVEELRRNKKLNNGSEWKDGTLPMMCDALRKANSTDTMTADEWPTDNFWLFAGGNLWSTGMIRRPTFIKRIEVGERARKYSRSASRDIIIHYRDIGMVDNMPQELEDSVRNGRRRHLYTSGARVEHRLLTENRKH